MSIPLSNERGRGGRFTSQRREDYLITLLDLKGGTLQSLREERCEGVQLLEVDTHGILPLVPDLPEAVAIVRIFT